MHVIPWRIPFCWNRPHGEKKSEVAQSCPTLGDPMDHSLPGFSDHGIFQARVLEWVAISFSRGSSWPRDQTWVSRIAGRCLGCVCVCVCAQSLSCVRLFAVLWTVVHQGLLSMQFSGQEHWCRLSFSTPRDLPGPGIKPEALTSPALAGALAPLGKPLFRLPTIIFIIVIVSSVACLTRLKSLWR